MLATLQLVLALLSVFLSAHIADLYVDWVGGTLANCTACIILFVLVLLLRHIK